MAKNETKTLKVKNGETLDTFYHGRIQVLQRREGYRFALDAPLLADFVRTAPEDEICELGTGNGIVALLLSIKPFRCLTAVEIQMGLADLARRNVKLNSLEERITVVRADLRTWETDERFDTVVCNPPYIKQGIGHPSASEEKNIAKHEVKATIGEILTKTAALLKKNGRAFFIYPTNRRGDFEAAAESARLAPSRFRPVQARSDTPPNLFLIELKKINGDRSNYDQRGDGRKRGAKKGDAPSKVPKKGVSPFFDYSFEAFPPLILYDPSGEWSEEAKAIFAGRSG
jgi:tRNA1Val (adenine37-N6)-methyltransferase